MAPGRDAVHHLFKPFLFFSALVWNSVHRIRDIGWNHWLGLLTAVPFANAVATLLLALVQSKRRSVWDLV